MLGQLREAARVGLGLTDSHFSQLATRYLAPGDPGGAFEGEVSRRRSNDSDDELEAEEYIHEAMENKLERHRRFFKGEPLMRSSKDEEARYRRWIDTLFYDNLYHEVQHGLRETRSQEAVRAYWKDVRQNLSINDWEIDEYDASINLEARASSEVILPQMGSVIKSPRGWKRPSHICLLSGKDLELQEIRNGWHDRKRNVAGAARFGTIQVLAQQGEEAGG